MERPALLEVFVPKPVGGASDTMRARFLGRASMPRVFTARTRTFVPPLSAGTVTSVLDTLLGFLVESIT